jgi:hypothetical protein
VEYRVRSVHAIGLHVRHARYFGSYRDTRNNCSMSRPNLLIRVLPSSISAISIEYHRTLMQSRATSIDYAHAFDSAAMSTLAGTPLLSANTTPSELLNFLLSFADERGHRRLVDKPLLAWVTSTPLSQLSPAALRPADFDVAAWTALATQAPPPARLLQGPLNQPFVPLEDAAAIEVATELELATLHAMCNHAWSTFHPRELRTQIWQRTLGAAGWLLDNLQPDNATNHPWAAHVFAIISMDDAHPRRLEAALYAQTLLHNSLIPRGVPDRFSAVVLLDAARQLRSMQSVNSGAAP